MSFFSSCSEPSTLELLLEKTRLPSPQLMAEWQAQQADAKADTW
jgi:hypothetical protein